MSLSDWDEVWSSCVYDRFFIKYQTPRPDYNVVHSGKYLVVDKHGDFTYMPWSTLEDARRHKSLLESIYGCDMPG